MNDKHTNNNHIEIPGEVREWLNRLGGGDGIRLDANTFTNQERWLMGRTTAQIWDYIKLDPILNCPLRNKCPLGISHCTQDQGGYPGKRWELYKKWASSPIDTETEVIRAWKEQQNAEADAAAGKGAITADSAE